MKKVSFSWLFFLLPIVACAQAIDGTIKTNTNSLIRNATTVTRANHALVNDQIVDGKMSRIEANSTTGTNSYSASVSWVTGYTVGLHLLVQFQNANTGASTININSLGAKNIFKSVSSALASGDISAGQILHLWYDGTNFQVIGGSGSGGGGGESDPLALKITNNLSDVSNVSTARGNLGAEASSNKDASWTGAFTSNNYLSGNALGQGFDVVSPTVTLTDAATTGWDWKSHISNEAKWLIPTGATSRTLSITNAIFQSSARLKIQKTDAAPVTLLFSHSAGNPNSFFQAGAPDCGLGSGNITTCGISLDGPAFSYFDIVFTYNQGFNGMFVNVSAAIKNDGSGGITVNDNSFITNSADNTKKGKFSLGGLPTATTYTVTWPSGNGTMALLSDFTASNGISRSGNDFRLGGSFSTVSLTSSSLNTNGFLVSGGNTAGSNWQIGAGANSYISTNTSGALEFVSSSPSVANTVPAFSLAGLSGKFGVGNFTTNSWNVYLESLADASDIGRLFITDNRATKKGLEYSALYTSILSNDRSVPDVGLVKDGTFTFTNKTLANPVFTGSATLGTLGYSDTGILGSFQSSTNSYNQLIIQNTNAGASASSNLNVSNDAATTTTNFAEFGINSSGFTGSGGFNTAGAAYVASASTPLVIGTYAAQPIRFVINNSATDAMQINSSGALALNGSFGTAGQVLQTNGSAAAPTWASINLRAFVVSQVVATDANITASAGQSIFAAASLFTANRTIDFTALNTDGDYVEFYMDSQSFNVSPTGQSVYFSDNTNTVTNFLTQTHYQIRRKNGRLYIIN